MPNIVYYLPPWNSSVTFHQFDAIMGVTTADPTLYYSTIEGNVGNSPISIFNYALTAYSRAGDITTVTYTWTGGPPLQQGSLIAIAGVTANVSIDYTGMALAAAFSHSNTSWTASYVNPGWDFAQTVNAGTLTTVLNPCWTTGLQSIPSQTTSVESQQNVITAQFEPGYEQRQAASINSNADQWNLVFANRSSREAKMIRVFAQNAGGVYPFQIMVGDTSLNNQPNQKYVTTAGPRVNNKSYNINDITLPVKMVFEP